jgi:hypothetical protein
MTQSQMIEGTIPMYFRCLCVPVEWRRAVKERVPAKVLANKFNSLAMLASAPPKPKQEQDGDFLEVERVYCTVPKSDHAIKADEFFLAPTFDPWAKRNEFFRLEQGDTEALLTFLRSVGLFERPHLGDKDVSLSNTLLSAQDARICLSYLSPTS